MKRSILAAGALVAAMVLAAPAFARCGDDLKAARSAAARLPDARAADRQAVKKKLDEADAALGKRDEHGCKNAVAATQAMMK
ncbi:MAG: hypothetical protein IT562_21530 [Alphaproteobacteria bacterium]|nr:hypothetical protein [Alphaproteobacteria bacterium]